MDTSLKLTRLLLLLLSSIATCCILAEENSSVQNQMEEIESQISTLNAERVQNTEEMQAFQQQIQGFDQQIAGISKQDFDLQTQAKSIQGLLDTLSGQDQAIVNRIKQEEKTLATHVSLGWQNVLNSGALLQADDNNQRLIHRSWLEYLAQQQAAALERLKAANTQLLSVRGEQTSRLQELEQAKTDGAKQQQLLREKKDQRENAISVLRTKLSNSGEQLTALEQDREELTGILKRLKAARDDNAFAEKGTPFGSLKGKLPWPHSGEVVDKSASTGVTLAVTSGDPVMAIAAGRVAYAEWLKGFGLLLILDHGDGYMSLYGNNESIYRNTGDWVEAGDVLSAAGQSGGRQQAGLYFEIREQGKSVNPEKWCDRSVVVNQISLKATKE